MIGIWSVHAQQYLMFFTCSTAVLFSLPIFISPIHWARVLRWKVLAETDLILYFGRCLGALALVINLIVALVAIKGEGIVIIFHGLNLLLVSMVGLHIYGAVKQIQPITETLEIGFWSVLLVLNLCFQPIA